MLYFPLTYDQGGLKTSTNKAIELRHLLSTIAGERLLAPSFGVPLDVLYSTNLPAVLAERVRMIASQITGVTIRVEVISYANGELKLKVFIAGEEVTATYATG